MRFPHPWLLMAAAALVQSSLAAGGAQAAPAAPASEFADVSFPDKAGRFSFEGKVEAPRDREVLVSYIWPGRPPGSKVQVKVRWTGPLAYYSPDHDTALQYAPLARLNLAGAKVLGAGELMGEVVADPPPAGLAARAGPAANTLGTRQDFLIEQAGSRLLFTQFYFYRDELVWDVEVVTPAPPADDPARARFASEVVEALLPAISVRNYGGVCDRTDVKSAAGARMSRDDLAFAYNCQYGRPPPAIPSARAVRLGEGGIIK